MNNKNKFTNNVAIVTGNATGIVGKDAEELIELRRTSSDEEFFRIVEQNIFIKEEQEFPFPQNRSQGAAEEQFRIKKVVVDGERPAS